MCIIAMVEVSRELWITSLQVKFSIGVMLLVSQEVLQYLRLIWFDFVLVYHLLPYAVEVNWLCKVTFELLHWFLRSKGWFRTLWSLAELADALSLCFLFWDELTQVVLLHFCACLFKTIVKKLFNLRFVWLELLLNYWGLHLLWWFAGSVPQVALGVSLGLAEVRLESALTHLVFNFKLFCSCCTVYAFLLFQTSNFVQTYEDVLVWSRCQRHFEFFNFMIDLWDECACLLLFSIQLSCLFS